MKFKKKKENNILWSILGVEKQSNKGVFSFSFTQINHILKSAKTSTCTVMQIYHFLWVVTTEASDALVFVIASGYGSYASYASYASSESFFPNLNNEPNSLKDKV